MKKIDKNWKIKWSRKEEINFQIYEHLSEWVSAERHRTGCNKNCLNAQKKMSCRFGDAERKGDIYTENGRYTQTEKYHMDTGTPRRKKNTWHTYTHKGFNLIISVCWNLFVSKFQFYAKRFYEFNTFYLSYFVLPLHLNEKEYKMEWFDRVCC